MGRAALAAILVTRTNDPYVRTRSSVREANLIHDGAL
jgi:hypothetical protein